MSRIFSNSDVDVLRSLGEKKAVAAQSPENQERRNAWYLHDEGTAGRPMILAETQGIRDENCPVPDSVLLCGNPSAQSIERSMRLELYNFEILKDDHVIEPWIDVRWDVEIGNYGVEPVVRESAHGKESRFRRVGSAVEEERSPRRAEGQQSQLGDPRVRVHDENAVGRGVAREAAQGVRRVAPHVDAAQERSASRIRDRRQLDSRARAEKFL